MFVKEPFSLSQEVKRFHPEDASSLTPPSSWYLRKDFLNLEKQTVFKKNWIYVGRVDQLSEVGCYFTGVFLDEPYLVVRSSDTTIQAFSNTCLHHGTCVAKGEGKKKVFVCPYHAWTYKLNGEFRSADLKKHPGLSRYQLKELPLEIWNGLVFLCFGPRPETLNLELQDLKNQLDQFSPIKLKFKKRVSYSINCNWKVFVDNYLDGGYHVPVAHKKLAKELCLESYESQIYHKFSIQKSRGQKTQRIGDQALYAWIYPNLMINRYGPMMDINWVLPVDVEQTVVIFDYFYEEPIWKDESFVSASLIESDEVQKEDIGLCEMVQAGMRSDAFDRGVYVDPYEKPMLHFHQLLFKDLMSAF